MRIQKTWVGESCTTGAIVMLSDYQRPAAAMKKFCQLVLLNTHKRHHWAYAGSDDEYEVPQAFYVFNMGTEEEGEKFANYIKRHKLGRVVTPGPVPNKAFHPSQHCQAWVWAPDRAALIEWWEKTGSKRLKRYDAGDEL